MEAKIEAGLRWVIILTPPNTHRLAKSFVAFRMRSRTQVSGKIIHHGDKPLDFPPGVLLAIEKPVVQPRGPALPELDHLRHHPVAAPERGQRNLAVGEFLLNLGELLHQEFPRSDDLALVGNPRADLRVARAGGEILERLGGADLLHRALDDHLPLQRDPREKQAHARDLAPFVSPCGCRSW